MTSGTKLELREEPLSALELHAEISIAFLVDRLLEVSVPDSGLGGIRLREQPVKWPYVKDYDEEEGPTRWPERFDTSNWGLISAHREGRRVGGAVIAHDTPALYRLRPGGETAALWDLRVDPDERAKGVGTQLFRAVERWAQRRGCRALEIETQNTNVTACHFYVRMGCVLALMDRFAYPNAPAETQLIWRKELS
jgi:GNAT superfamily N-acetyltransferase